MTANGHIPRKRFGQHFLHDSTVLQRISDAINPQADDAMVEIGPGLGALTDYLLPRLNQLHVVELDRDLADRLEQRPEYPEHLVVHRADAMKFDYCTLAASGQSLRIVGNLPYNISTPLIFHLLSQSNCIADMVFMLQKEVVDRLTAVPGNKDYGRLSVMVQAQCSAFRLFVVKPGAFNPPPKVDSAIVRLIPDKKRMSDIKSMPIMQKVVQQAFSQRRKTLRNTLKGLISVQQLEKLGIDPQKRPETLTVEQYIALSNLCST